MEAARESAVSASLRLIRGGSPPGRLTPGPRSPSRRPCSPPLLTRRGSTPAPVATWCSHTGRSHISTGVLGDRSLVLAVAPSHRDRYPSTRSPSAHSVLLLVAPH